MHSKIHVKSVTSKKLQNIVFVILLSLKGCEPTKHFEINLLVITLLPRLILLSLKGCEPTKHFEINLLVITQVGFIPQVVIWKRYDTK